MKGYNDPARNYGKASSEQSLCQIAIAISTVRAGFLYLPREQLRNSDIFIDFEIYDLLLRTEFSIL